MASFSPTPSYITGALCFGLVFHCLLFPRQEYGRFGLPLETPRPAPRPADRRQSALYDGDVSPLIHIKTLREFSIGALFIAFQYQGNDAAVTTTIAVTSVMAFGDGLIVWLYGGKERRRKAWGHWGAGAGLVYWAWWRAQF